MYKFVFALGVLVIPAQAALFSYTSVSVNAGDEDIQRNFIDGDLTTEGPLPPLRHSDTVVFNDDSVRAESTYSTYAGFDKLGVSFSGTTFKDESGLGDVYASGVNQLVSLDHLFFNVDSGFLKLAVLFDGSYSPPVQERANQFFVDYRLGVGGHDGYLMVYAASVQFDERNFYNVHFQDGVGLLPADPPVFSETTNRYSTTFATTIRLHFTNGELGLSQEMIGYWACFASEVNPSCSLDADFLNTAALGGALIVDANGNPIPGATITSASGFDYTRTLGTFAGSPVPEPSTILLMSVGLGVLFVIRSNRRT